MARKKQAKDIVAGLREKVADERDFKLGQIVKLPELSELPPVFDLGDAFIKDQIQDGNDDFCSAYMTTGISEFQEGVQLDPVYSFAASKSLSGDPSSWGQDLRTAMASHVKLGGLALQDEPANFSQNLTPEQRREFGSFPQQLRDKAMKHQKKTYVDVTGQYDPYDDIRASIWAFRAQKRAVGSGVRFGWDLGRYVLDSIPSGGFGHAMYIKGWGVENGVEGLVYVNSAGLSAGRNGLHLVPRSTVNEFADKYGAMMYIDMAKEEALACIQQNTAPTPWQQFINFILHRS